MRLTQLVSVRSASCRRRSKPHEAYRQIIEPDEIMRPLEFRAEELKLQFRQRRITDIEAGVSEFLATMT